ncbi:hypothetical protein [Mycoplasma sp. E35C]|uniref:hypothetical protein n=1 Tax=Mycoplasma sp. E35C TaxID=2801918 RepID=UPI001CA41685|nr:hypothetical protein [Mycoplasma sp. E35C]QZX48907.1 hypothetical protein JJE79_02510 [Mycoplasma sp. E35C]
MNKKLKIFRFKKLLFLPVILTPLVLASCSNKPEDDGIRNPAIDGQSLVINSDMINNNNDNLIKKIEFATNKLVISPGNGIDGISLNLMKNGTDPMKFEGLNWMHENNRIRQRRHTFFNDNKLGVMDKDFQNLAKLIKINDQNVVLHQITEGVPSGFYSYDGMQTADGSIQFTFGIKKAKYESNTITMDLVINGKGNSWSTTVSNFKITNV